jgi:hypothetical protein
MVKPLNLTLQWQKKWGGVRKASYRRSQYTSALAKSEISWQAYTKVVCTPTGVMLYPNDQIYHWLPRHGFTSDAEFERFVEIAKSKLQRHYDVA